MSFACPTCRTPQLAIAQAMELLPDSRSDDITLQRVVCSGCGFQGVAVYEESRRGALDSECFEHYGYALELGSAEALFRYLADCPDPGNPHCRCSGHQILGRHDASGRWSGLESVSLGTFFTVHRL